MHVYVCADPKAVYMGAQPEKHDNVHCILCFHWLNFFCGAGLGFVWLLSAGATVENYMVMKKFEQVRERNGDQAPMSNTGNMGGVSMPADGGSLFEITVNKPTQDTKLGVDLQSNLGADKEPVVSTLVADSILRAAGLREGDYIVEVGGKPASGAIGTTNALKSAVGEIKLVLRRHNQVV